MLKYFCLLVIILLVIWFSFFPSCVLQAHSGIAMKIAVSAFLVLALIKRKANIVLTDLVALIFLFGLGINVFFAQRQDLALCAYWNLCWPFFCIYYLISKGNFLQTKFRLLAKIICSASFLVALLGIFELLFAFNPIYAYLIENPYYQRYICGFVRPMSTQLNPAPLGTYLLACLPFNLLFFRDKDNFFRNFSFINIVFSVTVIILTFSRGVFLALVFMVLIYLLVEKRYILAATFLALTAVFVIFCYRMPYPFSKLGADLIPSSGKSILAKYRIDRFIMTKDIISRHPFTGLGLENLRVRFGEFYPGTEAVGYEHRIMDNMYLTLICETGIFGFAGFCLFIFYLLSLGFKKLKLLKDLDEGRVRILIIILSFTSILINMAGYELFYWNNQYLIFCLIAGLLAGLIG